MTENTIYETCPEYETKTFRLRLVRPEDAGDLLDCYSDRDAVAKMNGDNCTSDFYYTTKEEMEECIRFWLSEYERQSFVRFAVIPKVSLGAVGTVEVFGGKTGVLRIDMPKAYDREEYIEELLRLAVLSFIRDFEIKSLKIKTSNTPERIVLLKKYGFVLSKTFRPQSQYYERTAGTLFAQGKGTAFCGLACCVCSENSKCAGCKCGGCKDSTGCKSYNCCMEKGIEGCWVCEEFPCENPMFGKLRIRTFAKYIAKYGAKDLIQALKYNEEHGVIYHYEGELIGDYDLLLSEQEIFDFLRRGNQI